MPGNKKPRKAYRPKHKLLNPIGYVTETLRPLARHDNYALNWKLKNHSAMLALTRGEATPQDINTLVSCRNICEALFRTIGLVDADGILAASEQALVDICDRGNKTGRPVVKAPEMQALNDLMALHDELMDSITVGQMERAIEFATKELSSKRARPIQRPAWTPKEDRHAAAAN